MLEKLFVFAKAQVSALTGGIADYLLMIFFTEFFHVHYTLSIVFGGIIGAVINFALNKSWTFHSKELPYMHSGRRQLIKFILVVLNSVILKASGTYFFTTYLKIDYKISRIMTDLAVSLVFNFGLQKNWVFKKHKKSESDVLPLLESHTARPD